LNLLKKFQQIFITSEYGLCEGSMEMWVNGMEEVVDVRFGNIVVGRHRRVGNGKLKGEVSLGD
jgi:hypothetical protein